MQSGIEDNTQNVKELENEINFDEKCNNVSSEKDSIPNDTQVETEKNGNVAENSRKVSKQVKVLTPCLKSRNSSDNFIHGATDKNKKNYPSKSFLKNKSQNSDSNLVTKPTGFSKILTWDPWHKIGRNKNKKDKRKNDQSKEKMIVSNHNTGDGPKSIIQDIKIEENNEELNLYQIDISETLDKKLVDNLNPKPAKIRKIVRFSADVKVVHYADDEILSQTIEPLKKELEQQERNKELRKEFSPETGLGLKQSVKKSASDYMAAWYKK